MKEYQYHILKATFIYIINKTKDYSMKHILMILVVSGIIVSVAAQDDTTTVEGPWKSNGMATLNFSQVSLTNWAQGGESSYAINALSAFNLNYSKDRSAWDNALDIGYGIQKIGDKNPGKTDDHIDLLSKYGYNISGDWYISSMLNIKTQFTKGYQETDAGQLLISDLFSPGYILLAIGLEYKPNDNFYFSVSPVGGKITMVMNDSLSKVGSFGVDAGKTSRSELGGTVKMGINKDIMENVNLTTTLDLFSSYTESPQNIDISWKAMINMKVNEFLSATISTHLLYDDDIAYTDPKGVDRGPRVQFKEILGIGLSFKF